MRAKQRPRDTTARHQAWRYRELSSAVRTLYGTAAHTVVLHAQLKHGALHQGLAVLTRSGQPLDAKDHDSPRLATVQAELTDLLGNGAWILDGEPAEETHPLEDAHSCATAEPLPPPPATPILDDFPWA